MGGPRKAVADQVSPETPQTGADGALSEVPQTGADGVAPEVPPTPDPTPQGVAPGDVAPTTPAPAARDASDVPDEGDVKVEMLIAVTGTRNGEKWPEIGASIALPADEATQYIANGYARPAE